MYLRCIFAVPDLEGAQQVEEIRARFDPSYHNITSHVTLVFPFIVPVSNAAIGRHMEIVLQNQAGFNITFDACCIGERYAYLPVLQGADIFRRIYNELHTGILATARLQQRFRGVYRPHLTIGRVKSQSEALALARAAAGVHRGVTGFVHTILLETMLPGDRARVEHVVHLGN